MPERDLQVILGVKFQRVSKSKSKSKSESESESERVREWVGERVRE